MGSLRPALPPKIDPKLFGLARSTWANVLTARRRKALGQNYRGNNLACAPRPAGQHRGLGCLWSGNIDLGHIASSRWPEYCFSAFATWYHGHKRGTHGRLITHAIHTNEAPNRASFIPNYRPQQIYTDRKHQKLMPRRNVDGRVLHEVPTGQYPGDSSDMGGK